MFIRPSLTLFVNTRSSVCSSSIRLFTGFSSEEQSKPVKDPKRVLKQWRQLPSTSNDPISNLLDLTSFSDDRLYKKKFPLKPTEFAEWWKDRKISYNKWSQRFIRERHATLGKDLAITHYILHREGRVRLKGQSDYLNNEDLGNLPNTYEPTWYVEEIDASGIDLYYEALDNFQDLDKVKTLRFCGNPNFDDWCVERILALCPKTEYLDVSNCERVSERCLEGIHRNLNLKTLIITDFYQTPAFELTVMLLEDVRPNLKIIVKQPTDNSPTKKTDETKPTTDNSTEKTDENKS